MPSALIVRLFLLLAFGAFASTKAAPVAPDRKPISASLPGAPGVRPAGASLPAESVTPNPFEWRAPPRAAGRIDELVFGRLERLGIEPAHVCSDVVFIRRVFLDVIGTLPTASEVRTFLADTHPDKRARVIDRLLVREEFADYWTMKWCDILRVKAEFPINLWPNAAQAYHRWIYAAVRDNVPYDQFVRALLTCSGSNFRAGAVNFYRAMQNRDAQGVAHAVALAFLASRMEKWPADQTAGFVPFFSAVGYKATQEWKEEIIYFDPEKLPVEGVAAVFPAVDDTGATRAPASTVRLTRDRDPREVFADWLTRPDNPQFARAFVNRAWGWLLGRGIVEEVDDMRPDNAASNPELLRFLEQQFVASHFDVKALFRLILNSHTYQLSSIARSDRPEAAANFASYALRRVEAEVLIDALNDITGTTEKYSSAIPEPYTFIPETERSVALPDGSITSSFLELFGRPARDTGEQSERNNRITASQRLHLLNSTQVQRKIEQGPKLQALFRSRRAPREIITELYLTVLSRPPNDDERAVIAEYISTHDRRTGVIDTAWSLINTPEFLYRH